MGTFAETFRATDRATGRTVAVKLLREHLATDPVVVSRFQNEARTAASFHHASVVEVLDYGQDSDALFTVMELVDGGSLDELVRAQAPLNLPAALTLIHGILAALTEIHRKHVVHRDVKPANILLTSGGTAKLADFGIARAAHANHLTKTGLTLGTAAYMAPEQALGETVGPATDLYAAGVILFELLTGQLPFPGDDPLQVMYRQVHDRPPVPHSLNPSIPTAVSAVLLRTLDKDPGRRFANAQEMWNALEQAREAAPQGASAIETRDMPVVGRTQQKPVRIARLATSLIAAAVILMAGALGLNGFARGSTAESVMTPTSSSSTAPLVDTLPPRTASATATNHPAVVTLGVASAEVGAPVSTPTATVAPTTTPVPTAVSPTPTPPTEIVTAPIVRSDAPDPTAQPTDVAHGDSNGGSTTTDQPSSPLPPPNDHKDNGDPPPPPNDRKDSKDPSGSKDAKDPKPPKAPKDTKAPPKAPKDPPSSHRPPKGH